MTTFSGTFTGPVAIENLLKHVNTRLETVTAKILAIKKQDADAREVALAKREKASFFERWFFLGAISDDNGDIWVGHVIFNEKARKLVTLKKLLEANPTHVIIDEKPLN